MNEKVNVAELLRYSPNGIELDCPMYDKVSLIQVLDGNAYPIKIETPDGQVSLTKYGSYTLNTHAKCIIFPKGKTTWEGFVPPCEFKDGDVIYVRTKSFKWVSIFMDDIENKIFTYTDYNLVCDDLYILEDVTELCAKNAILEMRLATEEEKERLFKAIGDNGYKWDPDTKTLLTVPKFKAGDWIKRKDASAVHVIKMIDTDLYVFDDLRSIPICVQNDYELVPKKFDINTLKPFDRVLVRNQDCDEWHAALWGHFSEKYDMRYDTTRGLYRRCIPYEGNEHLLGKTDDCDEYYKTW